MALADVARIAEAEAQRMHVYCCRGEDAEDAEWRADFALRASVTLQSPHEAAAHSGHKDNRALCIALFSVEMLISASNRFIVILY